MSRTISIDLGAVGNSTAYTHYDKLTASGSPLLVGGGLLKWYDVAPRKLPVAPDINDLARQFLTSETAVRNLQMDGELGFVVLHRCGNDFYFLLPGIWRNGNELWESVYIKDKDAGDFCDYTLPGPNRATYCIWELAAVWHERNAWRSFVMSSRDETAKQMWLDDQFMGAC